MRLKDKVALITGSSRGIGKAISLAFAREGAKVVVCAQQKLSSAEAIASDIQQKGGKATAVRLDIRDRQSVRDMLNKVTGMWDGIDILVNNAGTNIPKAFDEVTDDDWNTVIGVNLTGTFVPTSGRVVELLILPRSAGKSAGRSQYTMQFQRQA